MFATHIKSAFRRLVKQRLGTTIHLVGLSVAMTASILIFIWVQNELNYDSGLKDAKQIFRITENSKYNNSPETKGEGIPLRMQDLIRNQVPGVERVGVILPISHLPPAVKVGEHVYREKKTAYVDTAWLNMFPPSIIKGSMYAFIQDPNGLLVTEATAKRYFGTQDPIGQVVRIDQSLFTVRGVTMDNPTNSSFDFDLLQNIQARLEDSTTKKSEMAWYSFHTVTFVKVLPGSNLTQIGNTITEVYRSARKVNNKFTWFTLLPLKDIHFETDIPFAFLPHGGDRATVSINALYKNDLNSARLFMDFSWMAVLISALGLLGLAAFTAEQRTREIGIRKVLGASVSQLMVLLSGSFLGLVILGILIGTPVAWWAGHQWLQKFVYRTSVGLPMFMGPAFAAILVAVVTISIQTWQAGSANPVKSLRTE